MWSELHGINKESLPKDQQEYYLRFQILEYFWEMNYSRVIDRSYGRLVALMPFWNSWQILLWAFTSFTLSLSKRVPQMGHVDMAEFSMLYPSNMFLHVKECIGCLSSDLASSWLELEFVWVFWTLKMKKLSKLILYGSDRQSLFALFSFLLY